MTICISAICTHEQKENIVFAVDHMITTGMGQFEHDIKKYEILTDNTIGMISGNALLMDYFLNGDYTNKSYSEIQKEISNKFKEKRLEIIQKEVLDVYSIDWDYVKELLKNPISNEFQLAVLKNIAKINLNTAILIMGFDDGVAKICEISDSDLLNFDKINFHTIGSGSIQAQNTLLFQHHSRQDDLKTTLYNVYKAKKNSEVIPGVGIKTDMGYINEKCINMIDKYNINILDELYEHELNYGKKHNNLNKLNV